MKFLIIAIRRIKAGFLQNEENRLIRDDAHNEMRKEYAWETEAMCKDTQPLRVRKNTVKLFSI